jgi:glycosidase
MERNVKWWQTTNIYQIYPRSFQDSNGDGIGDIPGIISRLDYLQDLGVETIWISPFYRSPGRDHGYDISDFRSVDPLMGTMADVEKLLNDVHSRGMKILFDITLNHTSDEHPWFLDSRSSKTSLFRDWYIWNPGKPHKLKPWEMEPPNNWISMTGKPGWNFDPETNEFYYANFLSFQPDLNWRNPEVKKEMFAILQFWFSKGVDGFRLDIFNSIYKDESLQDNPFSLRFLPSPDNNDEAFFQKKIYNFNHPDNFKLAREIRELADSYSEPKIFIGEVSGNETILKSYLGEVQDGVNDRLNLVFQFETIHYEFQPSYFYELFEKWEKNYPFPYTPTFVLGNHDQKRSIDRVDGDFRKAKILATIQILSRAVPVIYNGEEIGMRSGDFSPSGATDPLARGMELFGKFFLNFMGVFVTRDDARTPMPWNTSPQFGFCKEDVNPWLRFSPESEKRNVQVQLGSENSLLSTYKRLLHLRKNHPEFGKGEMQIWKLSEPLFAFKRFLQDSSFLVICNFSEDTVRIPDSIKGKKFFGLIAENATQDSLYPLDVVIIKLDKE